MPFLHCEGKQDITEQMELFTIDRDDIELPQTYRALIRKEAMVHSVHPNIYGKHIFSLIYSAEFAVSSAGLKTWNPLKSFSLMIVALLSASGQICLHCNSAIYYKKTRGGGVFILLLLLFAIFLRS